MSEIKLYETYSTVRNVMEQGWLDITPSVSPVDGTAIRTSVTTIIDTATLNNSQTVNTNTNLTNIQLTKVDVSTGNITLQLPDTTSSTYSKAFYFVKVENIDEPPTNTVTILPFAGQFIRDPYDDTQKSSIVLTFANQSITLFNLDGTDWQTNAFSVGSNPQAVSNTTLTTNIVNSNDNNLKYTGLNYVDLKNNKIINLLNPINSTDAASKGYVDSQIVSSSVMHNVVNVSSSNAPYTSINAALSSITTNSVSNPYIIQVGPGNYTETTITMKPYVDIVGSGFNQTTITASSTTQTIVIGTPNCLLSNLKLTGASGTGGKAITCTDFSSVTSFRVENVFFGSNDLHMEVSATSGLTMVKTANCSLGGTDNFNTGFYIHSTSTSFPAVLSCDSMSYLDITSPYSNIWFRVVGLGGQLSMNGTVGRITAATGTSTAIQAEEGSEVRINGCTFKGFINGIYSKLAGTNTGPKIYALGCYLENLTWNVNIENSATTGFINTNQNAAKVFIPDDSTFYIAGKDSHIINVSKTGGEYASISTALATITDSSATDRYVINVGPGIYNEPLIDMTSKPYVSIIGCVIQSTVIKPITATQNLFKLGTYNELSFMWLEGVGSGYSAVLVDDGGNYSQMHKVTFNDCDTGVKITSTSVDTVFYGEYLDINGIFTYGVQAISTSTGITTVNLENFYVFAAANDTIGVYATGTNTNCEILTAGFVAGPYTNTTGLIAENGAETTLNACYFEDWVVAVSAPNTGVAPKMPLSSISFEDNTTDLSVLHPSAIGNLTGNSHIDKITNNSSAFAWNFIDNETGALEITNKLNITFDDGVNTDLSTLITQSSPMGVLNGGVITVVSGLQINISAGDGYVDDPTLNSVTVKKLVWTSTNLTLPASENNFIYFNFAGTLSYSTSEPSSFENIIIGRVVTDASSVLMIDAIPFLSHHMSNRTETGIREAFGAIYNTGSLVTENATAYHLNVGSGFYYYGNVKFLPSGGTNINFKQFYRDGSGGWTISSVSAVNSTQYDNNSGTLASLDTGHYNKHSLYIIGEGANEQYLLVIGNSNISTLLNIEAAALPAPPSYFIDGVTLIAAITVRQGQANIITIEDARPVIGFKASGVSATATHGNLLGLSADDHTQYLLASGTRAMGGNLNMNTNNITNVGTINSVDITAHASRHLPNGADPLTTAAPSTIGTANATGTANSLARSDHVHSHGAQTDPTHHAVATITTNGFMSAADKVILDNLGTPNHSTLTNLTADDHAQYLNIDGRTGGQTATGGIAASDNLTLNSTSNITKGSIIINESTNSTSTTTGALVLNGTNTGLGMTGNLNVGGNIVALSGTITTPTIYGSATTLGNVTISANSADATGLITIGSALATFTNATDATSPTAAGATFAGGIGVSKKIRVADTTAATSTITGSIITAGGIGAAGNSFYGGTMNISGVTTITSATASTTTGTGALVLSGASAGLGVAGAINVGTTLNAATSVITPTVAGSTVTANNLIVVPNTANTTTGFVDFTNTVDASLTVNTTASAVYRGGVSILKRLQIWDTTVSTSNITGSIVTAGGLGVATNSFFGGTMNISGVTTITSSAVSTTTTTGALVVTGGVGIGGNITVGGNAIINNIATGTITAATLAGQSINTDLSIRPNTIDTTTGRVVFPNTVDVTTVGTGSAVFSGGVSVAKKIRNGDSTASTSTTTGSIITAGGLGVAGAAFIGTTVNAATSVITPTVAGSVTTANNLIIRPNTANLTTGIVDFTNTTDASTTVNTTASTVYRGGVSILKKLHVWDITDSTGYLSTTGSIVTEGGLSVKLSANIDETLTVNNVFVLSNVTIGTSLKCPLISGSALINGDITIQSNSNNINGGKIIFNNNVEATSTTTASTIFTGGLGIAKNIIVGAVTDSTSLTTGSIVTAGGLGVAKAIYCSSVVAGTINVDTTANTINNTTVNTDLSILTDGTGRVAVSGDPTANLHVATKQYVDNLHIREVKYKTADLARTNTTTFTADDQITGFAVVPGTYRLIGNLFVTNNSATPDFKYRFTATTTTIANLRITAMKLFGTGANTLLTTATPSGTVLMNNAELSSTLLDGTIEFTTASGTLNFEWAQNTLNGNNAILQRGSYIELVRIL
jgi:hypothetical protein